MICQACKCEDRWTDETAYAIKGHPELEEIWMTCECGHEQEVTERETDFPSSKQYHYDEWVAGIE